jgi:hypothetical protein
MVTQRTIGVILNAIGVVFILACFVAVAGHLRYLSKSTRPDRSRIAAELNAVVELIPGVEVSAVDIFDRKSVYVSASVRIKIEDNVLLAQEVERRLAQVGWLNAGSAQGSIARFCKDDLVTNISVRGPDGTYGVQVNWGNADAVCTSKR